MVYQVVVCLFKLLNIKKWRFGVKCWIWSFLGGLHRRHLKYNGMDISWVRGTFPGVKVLKWSWPQIRIFCFIVYDWLKHNKSGFVIWICPLIHSVNPAPWFHYIISFFSILYQSDFKLNIFKVKFTYFDFRLGQKYNLLQHLLTYLKWFFLR